MCCTQSAITFPCIFALHSRLSRDREAVTITKKQQQDLRHAAGYASPGDCDGLQGVKCDLPVSRLAQKHKSDELVAAEVAERGGVPAVSAAKNMTCNLRGHFQVLEPAA